MSRKGKLRKSRVALVVLFVFVIAFVVFKVSTKNVKKQNNESQEVRQVVYQDNLKFGISNFDTANPLFTKNKQLMDIYQLVYEPLFCLDSDYKIQPCLATEYAKTSATTYIVKINNSIKWSNESNLTADDVKFTVDLLKKKDNIYSENVKNIVGVEAIDNSTVKFNLSEDTVFFEYNLIFPIMCKNYYGDDDFFKTDKYHIGTGMYKITAVSGNQIILEKNGNYRDQDKINKNIENIYINIYTQVGEAYNSFKIGNVDILSTSSSSFEEYIGTMGYYIKEYKGREYDFLSCNCNDYIMKEKSVRQAINYGIDRENIVSTVYNNKYYTSDNVLDFGSFVYAGNVPSSGYNPEKAREVLENDGWVYSNNRWRKNGRMLSITIATNSSNSKRCEVAKNIKSQLENIGIQVTVWEVSDYQYKLLLENKNYQILLTGIYNGYSPELSYFYGENNIANYNNNEVKSLLNDLRNISDARLLTEKYKNINDITKDDCAYISLYRNKNYLLIKQNVIGSFEPTNYGAFRNFYTWNKE